VFIGHFAKFAGPECKNAQISLFLPPFRPGEGKRTPLNTDPSKTDSPEGQNLDPALPFRGIPIRKFFIR
jgi:hypothetical protein